MIGEKPYFTTFMNIAICYKIALKNKMKNKKSWMKTKINKPINTDFIYTLVNRLFFMNYQ